jgi:uncharacterized protein involved in tolerance to divalent cations
MSEQLEDLLVEADLFLDSGSTNFSNANSLIQDLKSYQSDPRVPPILARLRARRNPHNAPNVIVTNMSGRPFGSTPAGGPAGPSPNGNAPNDDDYLSDRVLEAELLLNTSSQVYNEFDSMINELKPYEANSRVPPLLERLRARRAALPMPRRNIIVTNMNGRPLGSTPAGAPVGPSPNGNAPNDDDYLSDRVLEAELLLNTSSQVYNEFDSMINELKSYGADPRVPPLLERLRARRAALPMPRRNIIVTNANGRPLPRRSGGKGTRKTRRSTKSKKQTRRRKN